ncbi:hypothetical protein EG68_11320 [Paragonimus skrjabini miyazakii]|uniref:CFA20 domain-containing protein n=1 Tax=Paragonimus skrjabini miyazakii TaxID=59628 RepID=A0A8S9YRU4_9TREM|nr:hypothetical protein EG68_11320 [Paragonimus skrjabini miyazakii]
MSQIHYPTAQRKMRGDGCCAETSPTTLVTLIQFVGQKSANERGAWMKAVNTKFVEGRSKARGLATSRRPFCDLLKLYPLEKWKKQGVGPPIRYITANDINSRVLCIEGTVTGSNSIILPGFPEKTLGFRYSFIYFLLRPITDKGFIIQLDVKTFDNLDLRITLSNVFNDTKVTNLSLHLPLIVPCSNSCKNNHNMQNSSGWTFVKLNIPEVISIHNKRKFVCLSRIQICSSLLLRSIFLSDLNYSPLVSRENPCSGRYRKLGQYPIPREVYSSHSKENDILRTVYNISFPTDPSSSDSVSTNPKSSVCNQPCMDEESVNNGPVFQIPLSLPLHGVNAGWDLSNDCQYDMRMKPCSGSDASKSNNGMLRQNVVPAMAQLGVSDHAGGLRPMSRFLRSATDSGTILILYR